MEDLRNSVTLHELDGSLVEVYLPKQMAVETTLCMKVYMVCFLFVTFLVMRSAFV